MKRLILLGAVGLCIGGVAIAANNAPSLVNYQGVLRTPTNTPMSGNFDMVFGFFASAVGGAGDLILVDSHTLASGGQVSVSGGLFNVALGSGAISDGSGPGVFTSLAQVFKSFSQVYLEVTVNGETLAPRTPIASAAYSLNASEPTLKGIPNPSGPSLPKIIQETFDEFVVTYTPNATRTGATVSVEKAGRPYQTGAVTYTPDPTTNTATLEGDYLTLPTNTRMHVRTQETVASDGCQFTYTTAETLIANTGQTFSRTTSGGGNNCTDSPTTMSQEGLPFPSDVVTAFDPEPLHRVDRIMRTTTGAPPRTNLINFDFCGRICHICEKHLQWCDDHPDNPDCCGSAFWSCLYWFSCSIWQ